MHQVGVIVGIRPGHFEGATLVEDAKRPRGGRVEVLESMGSDKFAYFSLSGGRASARQLEELAAGASRRTADLASAGTQITTRLSAASQVAEGRQAEVWFDADQVQVFDPSSGRNLTT